MKLPGISAYRGHIDIPSADKIKKNSSQKGNSWKISRNYLKIGCAKEFPIHHLPPLISDLAVILAVAGVVTLLFKKIGQPVVLGYLIAGFLVGPEISFIPTIQEKEAIQIWAEIGVIVLLFGLGLEFSFKKLASVGRGATITSLTEVFFMLALGYLLGQGFGWSKMDSLFLGGMLSISSTTIIIRAFEELGLKQRKFVTLVFGVLIMEDLVAILLMVLLSTIAVSNTFEGMQLLTSTLRLGFLLTLWLVGGIFIIPWFLRKTRSLMNEETSLIVSLALCLLMVLLSSKSGFSPALGAFIMGSILAETPDGEKIEHTLKPVKDLFAAIFFVSVGMLIELQVLQDYWKEVLIITFATIVGKLLSTTLGALVSGQSLKTSLKSGLSLAQIGEFSFIIATLGMTLKVTSNFLYPLAVAVSALTTLATPYMIRAGDPIYNWVEKHLPESLKSRFEFDLSTAAENPGENLGPSSTFFRLFLNTILVIAVGLSCSRWLHPFLQQKLTEGDVADYFALLVAMFLATPFLWAIVARPSSRKKGSLDFYSLRELTSRALLALMGRALIGIILLGFIVSLFTSAFASFLLAGVLSILFAILGFRNSSKLYAWMESQFVSHLNEKELAQLKSTVQPKPTLAPWDAHLAEVIVHPDSTVVGKNLSDLGLRENLGVIVALIERGSRQIMAPRHHTQLMAFDRISVIGTDEQVVAFSQLLQADAAPKAQTKKYGLSPVTLNAESPYIGKTIRDSGLREATDGLVVGIERNGQRILNPDSALSLQIQDLLWIVGNQELILKLQKAP